MKGFVEILSGIVRVGPEADGYGKPFEFAVAFSSVDGKTAMIKALVVKNEKTVGDFEYTRAVIEALRNVGLKIDWERVKPEDLHITEIWWKKIVKTIRKSITKSYKILGKI